MKNELASSRDVRIYKEDWEKVRALHKKLYDTTSITMTELLREAVHRGLPSVLEEYEPKKSGMDTITAEVDKAGLYDAV